MKVALVQTDIVWNDPAANIQQGKLLATQAVTEGAELLIFPEMFTCGFSKPTGDLAQESYASGAQFLQQIAQEHAVCTIGSLPQPTSPSQIYNVALACKADGSVEHYQKIHLFSSGDESVNYSAGSTVLNTEIHDVRCSIFICYDLRFPLPFHHLADKTDLYVVVANWPSSRREHWLTLLRARAIENQAYVAGVNRVGEGGGLSYSGDSVLFGPDGTQLTELAMQEKVIMGEVDPTRVADLRSSFPAIRDRRHDVYRSL